jgi:hypothetical protein
MLGILPKPASYVQNCFISAVIQINIDRYHNYLSSYAHTPIVSSENLCGKALLDVELGSMTCNMLNHIK